MIETGSATAEDLPTRHNTKLRKLGISVLVLAFVVAAIVYWLGTPQPRLGDDPSTVGFYKPQARQMGMLYGQMGVMMDDLVTALKRPAVQSGLIIAAAVIFCLICFHLARPPTPEHERLAGAPEPGRTPVN